MGTDSSSKKAPPYLSRRKFLGTAAGSAALALLKPSVAVGSSGKTPSVLSDYVGRLCYNENPLGPSSLALNAIIQTAGMVHRYPDWYADSLRSDLASLHGISSNQIIAGNQEPAGAHARVCMLVSSGPTGSSSET